jgi:hypothetical protein
MIRGGRGVAVAAPAGGTVNRARSHLTALVALTAFLLSGVLPALPHGHPTPAFAATNLDERGCPCPADHLDRQGNPAAEICPICSLTRLAAHGPVAADALRAVTLVATPLPPVSALVPERFLASAPEARGPPTA